MLYLYSLEEMKNSIILFAAIQLCTGVGIGLLSLYLFSKNNGKTPEIQMEDPITEIFKEQEETQEEETLQEEETPQKEQETEVETNLFKICNVFTQYNETPEELPLYLKEQREHKRLFKLLNLKKEEISKLTCVKMQLLLNKNKEKIIEEEKKEKEEVLELLNDKKEELINLTKQLSEIYKNMNEARNKLEELNNTK